MRKNGAVRGACDCHLSLVVFNLVGSVSDLVCDQLGALLVLKSVLYVGLVSRLLLLAYRLVLVRLHKVSQG